MATADLQVLTGSALTTTTTLTAIGGLSANVNAGGVYRFEVHGYYRNNASNLVNLVIAMGGSLTITEIDYQTAIQTALDGTSNHKLLSALANTTIAGASAPATANTVDLAFKAQGLVVVNAAGTFQAQARHTNTNAAAIQAGAKMILEQLS
jgi:hypothetical protein